MSRKMQISAHFTRQPPLSVRYRYPSDGCKSQPSSYTLLEAKDAFIEAELQEGGRIYRHDNDLRITVYLVNNDEDGNYLPHVYTLGGQNCENGFYQIIQPGNQPIRIPLLTVLVVKKADEKTFRENLQRFLSEFGIAHSNLELRDLLDLSFDDLKKMYEPPVRMCLRIESTEHPPIRIYTNPIHDKKTKTSSKPVSLGETGDESQQPSKDEDEYEINRIRQKKRKPEVNLIVEEHLKKKARQDFFDLSAVCDTDVMMKDFSMTTGEFQNYGSILNENDNSDELDQYLRMSYPPEEKSEETPKMGVGQQPQLTTLRNILPDTNESERTDSEISFSYLAEELCIKQPPEKIPDISFEND